MLYQVLEFASVNEIIIAQRNGRKSKYFEWFSSCHKFPFAPSMLRTTINNNNFALFECCASIEIKHRALMSSFDVGKSVLRSYLTI